MVAKIKEKWTNRLKKIVTRHNYVDEKQLDQLGHAFVALSDACGKPYVGKRPNAKKHRANEVISFYIKAMHKMKCDVTLLSGGENRPCDEPQKGSADSEEQTDRWLTLIESIIEYRDNLQTMARTASKEDAALVAFIELMQQDTAEMLSRNGVQVLNQAGEFDEDVHCSRGTVYTEQSVLVGQIAETFRDGYRTETKLIRHQEVKTFSST